MDLILMQDFLFNNWAICVQLNIDKAMENIYISMEDVAV